MWESKTDIGGSVFDLSTSYYLLFNNSLNFKEDSEQRHRFYVKQDKSKWRPHRFTLAVWKKSMSLRYLIESFLFFVLLLVFQFEISAFNKDLRISIRELKEFDLLSDEIIKKGGTPFDPENPLANRHLLD